MQSKTLSLFALSIALAFGASLGHAEEAGKTGKPLTAQQSRMKACNAKAKADALKGDERKAFMSSCLKGQHEATVAAAPTLAKAPSARQEQRKACGAEAKAQGIKGDERKAFVKQCMQRPQPDGAHG